MHKNVVSCNGFRMLLENMPGGFLEVDVEMRLGRKSSGRCGEKGFPGKQSSVWKESGFWDTHFGGVGPWENLLGREKVNASKVDKEGTCQEAEAGDKGTSLVPTLMKGPAWELGVWWELGGTCIIMTQGGFGSNRKALCSRQLIMVFLNWGHFALYFERLEI